MFWWWHGVQTDRLCDDGPAGGGVVYFYLLGDRVTCRRFIDTRELKKGKAKNLVLDDVKRSAAKVCLEMRADGFCETCQHYGLDFGCPFPTHGECGRKAREF